jgi:hypothetical protein
MVPRAWDRPPVASFCDDDPIVGPPPDIVATQGKHLLPTPDTPCFRKVFDHGFYYLLYDALDRHLARNTVREEIYGPDAQESRYGHTPSPTRAEHQSESENNLRQYMLMLEAVTPDSAIYEGGRSTPMSANTSPRTTISPVAVPPAKLSETTPLVSVGPGPGSGISMGMSKMREQEHGETADEEQMRQYSAKPKHTAFTEHTATPQSPHTTSSKYTGSGFEGMRKKRKRDNEDEPHEEQMWECSDRAPIRRSKRLRKSLLDP